MLFDSVQFLLFLPAVFIVYFVLPNQFRWLFLLAASYFFYGCWKIEFLGLLIYTSFIAYTVSYKIDRTEKKSLRRLWLISGLVLTLTVLFFFKYFKFFVFNRVYFQEAFGDSENIRWLQTVFEYGIPVGISFFTFQAVGYIMDIYTRHAKAETNFFKFALFISYFPQLVAGPIERYTNLHHQLFEKHKIVYENLSNGFRLILFGLFIKMAIADNLSPLVDPVFYNPLAYSQLDNILGLLFFSIQIYADFHGYSLIAIGVAMMMGIHLMDNFKTPYLSTSIREFWTRWHISLSTWFRDYLYLPLGGNRHSYFRWMINISIIFLVSGIWHGANFTFIVWGCLHGFAYLVEQIIAKKGWIKVKNNFVSSLGLVKTLLVVNLAWLFFRSDTLAKAYLTLAKIMGIEPNAATYYQVQYLENGEANQAVDKVFLEGIRANDALTIKPQLVFILVLLILTELWIRKTRFDIVCSKLPFTPRWLVYGLLIYCVMALSGPDFYQFIYFQF